MTPLLIVLYGLLSGSILLCVALTLAWLRFGRELHAAFWSLAYGLSAANWTSNLLMVWLKPDDTLLTMLGAICTVGSFALIALGFRRRAGLPLRIDAIAAAGGVTILFVAFALWHSTGAGAQRWMVLFFCAAMLGVSAISLRHADSRRSLSGGAGFWVLVLFAAYIVGLAGLALIIPGAPAEAAPMLKLFRLTVMLGVPTGLFGVGLFAMFLLAADLADGMRALALSDPLTGILNRRGFEQAAEQAIARCRRADRPLALVVADLDRFKAINDRHGHAAGDAALKSFADHAVRILRQGDVLGRLGGDEFVFVLPETAIGPAAEAVERLRAILAASGEAPMPDEPRRVSFGITEMGGASDTLATMLLRADRALYCSKVGGRDRITLAPSDADAIERIRTPRSAQRVARH